MVPISTIKDIAKHTGLSVATVSKYLNGGNLREKNKVIIEDAIKKLDYKINEMARGLRTKQSMTVGILIPSFENVFFTTIVSGIENQLIKSGYSTLILNYQEDAKIEKEKIDFLLKKNVDGIIAVSYSESADTLKELMKKKVPIVLLDRMIKGIECDVVLSDNLNAAYSAVEELIIRNHKKIGIILGPEQTYTTQERLKGFLRVHEDYGINLNEDLLKFGDYSIESGYNQMLNLWESESRPTAIFVTNYEMTLGAIMAINERNINIPEDLSLIGFDDMQLSKVIKPLLSLVVQPIKDIGTTAAEILLKRLSGNYENFPLVKRLKTTVKIRESVNKIRN